MWSCQNETFCGFHPKWSRMMGTDRQILQLVIYPDFISGRMALLITLFLVLINIFNNITTNSPKAEGLTAIEIWMLACILFVFGSLIGKVLISILYIHVLPFTTKNRETLFTFKFQFLYRIRSYLIPEAKSEQIWCTIPIHLRRKGHGGRGLGLRDAFGRCWSHFFGVRIGQNWGQFFFS